ncbi:hypothetical protein EOD29_32245, partial [Mesorhizobium sp. M1A.T.Ca.IN.004.03.1.1]|uniref:C1 family peptidase n=1 Tax=Mesorhizobium sp. M1A.T.Ca.IN.004.03.1.1 TaxID=2496795 RepID=UPI000FD5D616
NGSGLQFGPINPDFLRTQWDANSLLGSYFHFGARPGPLNLSHMTGKPIQFDLAPLDTLPSTYDLRTLGKLSPIENQGQCGSCWTFATMG